MVTGADEGLSIRNMIVWVPARVRDRAIKTPYFSINALAGSSRAVPWPVEVVSDKRSSTSVCPGSTVVSGKKTWQMVFGSWGSVLCVRKGISCSCNRRTCWLRSMMQRCFTRKSDPRIHSCVSSRATKHVKSSLTSPTLEKSLLGRVHAIHLH